MARISCRVVPPMRHSGSNRIVSNHIIITYIFIIIIIIIWSRATRRDGTHTYKVEEKT